MIDAISNPVPDARAQSSGGTRLKAETVIADDGAHQPFAYWYDSQRKEDCWFTIAADGIRRCLPAEYGASVSAYFSDATCIQRVAFVSATACIQPKYASESVVMPGCAPAGRRVYDLGPVFGGAVYQAGVGADGGMTCKGLATALTNVTFYTVGAEVAPSSFVGARLATDP